MFYLCLTLLNYYVLQMYKLYNLTFKIKIIDFSKF